VKTNTVAAIAAIALHQTVFGQAPASFEKGVLLNASDLLPAELLRGEFHRVRDHVATDGYMAHFEIDSDFGTFDAIGVSQARHRITEIGAIRKLVETSKGDLFAEGIRRSVEQPIDAVKNIVTHPVESVRQAPATVGHFFTKVGSAIGRAGGKVKDSIENDGPPPSGSEIGQAARNAAGFDKAKLDTARQLGVDPYSDNARLQEEMDKVTWAFFAGGLPLRVGAAVASAGVVVAATNMVGIPADTYALTQSELALRDGRSLAAMGISDEDIKTFQLYGPLSSTRRHRIVLALETLADAKGRGLIIRKANACETPEQADFLIAALSILAERQRSGAASYGSLQVLGRLPGAIHANGELHVPAPVDHVTWTEEVAGFAGRDDLGNAPKVLLHTGKLSEAAVGGFTAKGWKCVGVAYPAS
jgi:hypothetical protein